MTGVAPWVKDLVEGAIGPSPLHIGQRIKHESGCTVQIMDGQFWGTHGLSNFWYWQEVLPDGSLGRRGHGYGFVKNGILTGGEWEETK